MGAGLVEASPVAAARLADLAEVLRGLPEPPPWTLRDELLAGEDTSRVAKVVVAQPLCTAVQIILVDVLRAAGVSFAAVVGHSSGEIGAAYAAGLVSARDAIRIAYFRGVHAGLAASPSAHAPRGAMLAGKAPAHGARVVAVNAPSSVTLSGDDDAVDEAEQLLGARASLPASSGSTRPTTARIWPPTRVRISPRLRLARSSRCRTRPSGSRASTRASP